MSTTILRIAKLHYVAVDDGKTEQSNKFYYMFEQADGTIKIEYGRIEKTKIEESYPIHKWDEILRKKVKKGYKDVTHLYAEVSATAPTGATFADIQNAVVKRLVDELQTYANKSIKQNYTITSDKVTEAMVTEAQAIVDSVTGMLKVGAKAKVLNEKLLDLYKVIPRQMKNVKDHLFKDLVTKKDLAEAEKMIGNEQATLDVMAGQVAMNKAQTKNADPKSVKKALTMLEAMGLEVSEAPASDIPMIKKLMGSNANQFKRAYIVTNKRTQAKFDNYVKACKNKKLELFWHGSRNENWWSILETGLVLRPANAVISGKMFGYGTYFADKFQKSLGYTSFRGSYWAGGNDKKAFLALFQVHVGEQLRIKNHQSWCYELTDSKLKARGSYDSLYAEGGADLRNNEYIVYNEAQCTVKYLVEIE